MYACVMLEYCNSIIITYIEDITWPHGDTKFLFALSVEKHFTSEHNKRVKYFFQHEKRNFISPSNHVMFY